MKQFGFKDPIFLKRSRERQEYYAKMINEPVTEEEFVIAVESWPKKTYRNSRSRGASQARHEYRKLVRLYGFFPGGQNETQG